MRHLRLLPATGGLLVASFALGTNAAMAAQTVDGASVAGTANGSSPAAVIKAIPFKTDNASVANDMSHIAAGLLVCILLLAGTLYLLRRRFTPGALNKEAKQLRILESQRLSPRATLYVVEFAGQVHLLGQCESNLVGLAAASKVELPKGDAA